MRFLPMSDREQVSGEAEALNELDLIAGDLRAQASIKRPGELAAWLEHRADALDRVQASLRASRQERPAQPCGRLLVGQGDDTYDPDCVLPRGHEGLCRPEPLPVDREQPEGREERIRAYREAMAGAVNDDARAARIELLLRKLKDDVAESEDEAWTNGVHYAIGTLVPALFREQPVGLREAAERVLIMAENGDDLPRTTLNSIAAELRSALAPEEGERA
jgi:hypothetical protein